MRLQPQKQAPIQQKPASNAADQPPKQIRDILSPRKRRQFDPAGQEKIYSSPRATRNHSKPKKRLSVFFTKKFPPARKFFPRQTSLASRLDGCAESSNLSVSAAGDPNCPHKENFQND